MWLRTARVDQLPPRSGWSVWLQMGGRGAGKTRAGAEWVRGLINAGVRRIALVAPTYLDAREVMIEGESGLAHIGYPQERPEYLSSRRRLEWPNGAVGYIFSAEEPDGLRGPQFEAAWADEFCAWEHPEETLSNLRLGMRLGRDPKIAITTTPKNIPALRRLLDTPGTVVTSAPTSVNRHHLAAQFLTAIEAVYGGSHLARQELGGELLVDTERALWTRDGLAASCVKSVPNLDRIIVAVDPAVSHHSQSDATGIIVAGCKGEKENRRAYILADGTLQGVRPGVWAEQVANLALTYNADYVVAETNQGGNLIEANLMTYDSTLVVRPLTAKHSKKSRAVPVSILYQQGRVFHAGDFPDLEDELCGLGTSSQNHSPDRADALVWAVTELLLTDRVRPRIRQC